MENRNNKIDDQRGYAVQLRKAHPLVKSTLKRIRDFPADQWGMKRLRLNDCLPVSVTDATAKRILCVCDALIKRIEAGGGHVEVRSNWKHPEIRLVVDGEPISFGIREVTVRRRNTGPDRDEYGHKFIHEPTGLVAMYLGGYYRLPVRNHWADTETSRVEDSLDEVLESCRALAAMSAEKEKRKNEQRPYWEEQERQRIEEKRRNEQLKEWLVDWRKAKDIRTLVEDIAVELRRVGSERPADVSEMLEWMTKVADQIDPIKSVLRNHD